MFRHSQRDRAPTSRSLTPSASAAYLSSQITLTEDWCTYTHRFEPNEGLLLEDMFDMDVPGVFVTGKLMKGGSVGVLAVVVGRE